MERVIVTVKKYNETQLRDLDIPAELEISQLSQAISSSLHWDKDAAGSLINYQIKAEPLGRVLQKTETLSSAEISDGAWLIFIPEAELNNIPRRSSTAIQPDKQKMRSASPLIGWRSLNNPEIEKQNSQEIPESEKPGNKTSNYVWKEIDI